MKVPALAIAAMLLSTACLMAVSLYAGMRYQEIQTADDCERLGLIEIDGKAYTCDPVPPKTWEESEDFK